MRFLLLAGDDYYPAGAQDVRGLFATLDEARGWVEGHGDEVEGWAHIIDVVDGRWVETGYRDAAHKTPWEWEGGPPW